MVAQLAVAVPMTVGSVIGIVVRQFDCSDPQPWRARLVPDPAADDLYRRDPWPSAFYAILESRWFEPPLRAHQPHRCATGPHTRRGARGGWEGPGRLDVFEEEPLAADHRLWAKPRAVLTPHVAVVGPYVDDRRLEVFRENARRFVAGEALLNVVDKALWY